MVFALKVVTLIRPLRRENASIPRRFDITWLYLCLPALPNEPCCFGTVHRSCVGYCDSQGSLHSTESTLIGICTTTIEQRLDYVCVREDLETLEHSHTTHMRVSGWISKSAAHCDRVVVGFDTCNLFAVERNTFSFE